MRPPSRPTIRLLGTPQAHTAVFDKFVERLAPGGGTLWVRRRPGAYGAGRPQRGAGVRVLRYGSDPSAGLAGTLLGWESSRVPGRRASSWFGELHQRTMRLSVPGLHMALNALGPCLPPSRPVRRSRRFRTRWPASRECVAGSSWSARPTACGFDDYAHHPTEVRAALIALREVSAPRPGRPADRRERPQHRGVPAPFGIRAQRFSPGLRRCWVPPTTFVLDAHAAREQPLAGISGASIDEHVTVPVRYPPDFFLGGRPGRIRSAGRRGGHQGAGDVTMLGPEITGWRRSTPRRARRAAGVSGPTENPRVLFRSRTRRRGPPAGRRIPTAGKVG